VFQEVQQAKILEQGRSEAGLIPGFLVVPEWEVLITQDFRGLII
jgi:hypothetical protein